MREFLELKRRHDPAELFQSTWYRHYRSMFGSDDAERHGDDRGWPRSRRRDRQGGRGVNGVVGKLTIGPKK